MGRCYVYVCVDVSQPMCLLNTSCLAYVVLVIVLARGLVLGCFLIRIVFVLVFDTLSALGFALGSALVIGLFFVWLLVVFF